MVNFYLFVSLDTLSLNLLDGKIMKMKIDIDFDKKWIRRDPEWLATFLKGYLSQLAGYKVTNVELLDDNGNKIDNSSFSCSDCGELLTHEPHHCIQLDIKEKE